MKIVHRIPTSQFAYIEFEEEVDSPEDGMANHRRYIKMYEEKEGLSMRDWAKVRNNMLVTGQCDPNLMEEMSHPQRWFVNELKKALRAVSEEDVIN